MGDGASDARQKSGGAEDSSDLRNSSMHADASYDLKSFESNVRRFADGDDAGMSVVCITQNSSFLAASAYISALKADFI